MIIMLPIVIRLTQTVIRLTPDATLAAWDTKPLPGDDDSKQG